MDIRVTFGGNKKVDAALRGFTVHTDQPVAGAGDNTAPSPFELFMASLATCAGYYVLEFLNQRSIPTDDTAVTFHAERDPETKMFRKFTVNVLLPETFPDKYKNAILKVVDACAVKKHLYEPPQFETVVHIGDNAVASAITNSR